MTDNAASTDLTAIIDAGEAALGIEFGSTRIKAVLIGPDSAPIASGGHEWENRLEDGVWTYTLDDIREGLQDAYQEMSKDVFEQYGTSIRKLAGIGISAMMHGYLAFDAEGKLLVPFRTWRNTSTAQASEALTELFSINVPQRWSIAHLYQAILNGEEHVPAIASFNTLAGYVHELLTGEHVLGIGDASGMFPIDSSLNDYDPVRLEKFDAASAQHGFTKKVVDLLPNVLVAGAPAGTLTTEGAALLDPSGVLQAGIPLCPPEGDAGTGMVATNAVAPRTGNVSVGTSIFAMVVLEHELKQVHLELDPVTTPDGDPVAMVHSNNGTSELDGWVKMFGEFAALAGVDIPRYKLYDTLYLEALKGAADGGGILSYNFLSGEPITGLEEGLPLIAHTPGTPLKLADFMRSQLMTIFGSLRIGMDILIDDENVQLDKLNAHGGIFKTPYVIQAILAGALNTSIAVSATAGEGGAWGMAVLALYRSKRTEGQTLADFLESQVFAGSESSVVAPEADDVAGFDRFMVKYRKGLPMVKLGSEQ